MRVALTGYGFRTLPDYDAIAACLFPIPYFVVRFTASGDLSLCGLIKKEPPDLSIVKRLGDYCCRL